MNAALTPPPVALIVDDEANLRTVLRTQLQFAGYRCHTCAGAEEALAALGRLGPVDVILTDLRMPGLDGFGLLRRVRQLDPALPVIILTAFGSVGNAVEAVKAGAFDYLEKPFDRERLLQTLEKAVVTCRSLRTTASPVDGPEFPSGDGAEPTGRHGMLGRSPQIQLLFRVLERVATGASTVLIQGESGTGKELAAQAIVRLSDRRDAPFVRVNCAAIPENLMESEFFGHEKGAFTGATSERPGRFELAHQGTLLLDEVGEIPLPMQAKLLRVLQEGEFERVGSARPRRVDVRVLASTNRSLQEMVAQGRFREDLYYRLNVVPIVLPPLRERKGDIPLLIEAFFDKQKRRLNRPRLELDPAVIERLTGHLWPGNIRELENLMERLALLAEGPVVTAADLPPELGPPPPGTVQAAMEWSESGLKDLVRRETSRIEKDLILRALSDTDGNVTRAALLLRISRKGLQLKMKELGLRDDLEET